MLTKLIKSNFKNDFSHMISFFLIMVLSVFMFHTGIMIFNGYSSLHKEKIEKYNWADMLVLSALNPEDMEKIEEIISTSDYIESYEKQYPINRQFTIDRVAEEEDSKNAYDSSSQELFVLPYGEWGDIEAPNFVEMSDEEYDNPIYISIYVNEMVFKAKVGDSIDLKVNDKYYTFQVAGIYEGVLSNGLGLTFVKPALYNEWKLDQEREMLEAMRQQSEAQDSATESRQGDAGQRNDAAQQENMYSMTLFNMKLTPGTDDVEAAGQLSKTFDEHEIMAVAQGSSEFVTMFTYMQNMIAAMLMAFALVVAVISMIIIYFRISNSIEQNIVNIGALKALGYTSRQIRSSLILEFLITTSFAFFTGLGCSYLVIPVFEKMMRGSSAVVWEYGFDLLSLAVTAILILGTVYVVAKVSTRKIKKLDPVIALRFGTNERVFKHNHAPVEKTPGPLTWIMALKSLIGNKKQNIILFIVTLFIGAVTTFASFLAYNCVYDPMHLYRMLKLEAGDVMLSLDSDDPGLYTEISKFPEVDEIWWTDNTNFNVEGYSVYATITDDWKDIPDVNILKGRVPIYDNEIAMGGVISKILGVGIGDEVTIANGKAEKSFIIVGIDQDTDNMGKDIVMTSDGARHLGYEVVRSTYNVNVKDHSLVNSQRVIQKTEDMCGNKLNSYLNLVEALQSGQESVIIIAAIMVLAMVIISAAVVVLSMNLLVKTLIIKKQKEIGIKKALGFSSSQLRAELVLSMLPQIAFGAAVGAVLGIIGSNKVMATLLVVVGVVKSNMEIFPWMGLLAVLFSVVVSFVIIWIISARIKRISAYSLITE